MLANNCSGQTNNMKGTPKVFSLTFGVHFILRVSTFILSGKRGLASGPQLPKQRAANWIIIT